MFKRYYPHAYASSAFTIDYARLWSLGYRGLIFDIDNTLVHHGDDGTEETDALIREVMERGFSVLFLTNNDEPRVRRFLRGIDAKFICEADKPKPEGYLRALEMMGTDREHTLMIGDQVFSDIAGANRCGVPSILVKFITKNPDAPLGKKRKLEQVILRFYRKNKKMYARLGQIESL